jgi:5-methylcytosine-specific restriction endonuclease McrA
MFASGELHLSAIKLLAPVLTQQNAHQLLDLARFQSKRELELRLARRLSQPDVSSMVPQAPSASTRPGTSCRVGWTVVAWRGGGECLELRQRCREPCGRTERTTATTPPPRASARPALSPLGPERYKVQLTASQALHDKIRQAQDLMRHEVPDGDLGRVLERALDLLIAERLKRRFGKTKKPRSRGDESTLAGNSRHIPHAVRREVLARDGARCSYVSADGKRCEQRGLLELHHEQPYGQGGPASVANIRVLCRTHNQLLAEHDYGRAFMLRRIESARRERRERQLLLQQANAGAWFDAAAPNLASTSASAPGLGGAQ